MISCQQPCLTLKDFQKAPIQFLFDGLLKSVWLKLFDTKLELLKNFINTAKGPNCKCYIVTNCTAPFGPNVLKYYDFDSCVLACKLINSNFINTK